MNVKDVVFDGGSHVVILGAGASIASTLLNPEKNGIKLLSMNDLPVVKPMDDLLSNVRKELLCDNFEQLYTNLYRDNRNNPILKEINERVYTYFAAMRLPECPTIYDYLIMALRKKKKKCVVMSSCIDVKGLREFQQLDAEQQQNDKRFKITSSTYDKVKAKTRNNRIILVSDNIFDFDMDAMLSDMIANNMSY